MKKLLYTLLLSFVAFITYAQAPLIPSVRCSLSVVSVFTDPYTVTGKTVDFSSNWQASDISAGDSLYLMDGNELRVYQVVSISSASGTDFTIVINDINDSGSVPVTGEYGAIYRGTTNYDFPNVTAGISETLQMAIQNRFVQRLDALIKAAGVQYVTTDSFSTFISSNYESKTFADVATGSFVYRKTLGNTYQKTSSTAMTQQSNINGANASSVLGVTGNTLNFSARLNANIRLNTTGDPTTAIVNNPLYNSINAVNLGSEYLIAISSGTNDITVTWDTLYGQYNKDSGFTLLGTTFIPAQSIIYFKFRTVSPSAEIIRMQLIDDVGGSGGITNLSYTAATGVVANTNGTGFTIPLADGTNPGLLPSIPGIGGPGSIDPALDVLLGFDNSGGVNMSPTVNQVVQSVAAGGDVSGTINNLQLGTNSVGTLQIADDSVTLAKIATGTANRLFGTDGSGNPTEITAGSNITISGSSISAASGTTHTASNGIGLNASDFRLGNSYMASAPSIFTASRKINGATYLLFFGNNSDSSQVVFDFNNKVVGIGKTPGGTNKLAITGNGATSSTNGLSVENSSGNLTFVVSDNQRAGILSGTSTTPGAAFDIDLLGNSDASTSLFRARRGGSFLISNDGRMTVSTSQTSSAGYDFTQTNAFGTASGDRPCFSITANSTGTTGTGKHMGISVIGTINRSSIDTSETNISVSYRALPTLTAFGQYASYYSAISNTNAFGFYFSGASSRNYIEGSLNLGQKWAYTNAKLNINGGMWLGGRFLDTNKDAGTSGQILSSTGTATDWIDYPTNIVQAFQTFITSGTVSLTTNKVIIPIKADGTSGAVDVTLGSASNTGVQYKIIAVNVDNTVRVLPATGTINGSSSYTFSTPNQSVTIMSDGTNYWIF